MYFGSSVLLNFLTQCEQLSHLFSKSQFLARWCPSWMQLEKEGEGEGRSDWVGIPPWFV